MKLKSLFGSLLFVLAAQASQVHYNIPTQLHLNDHGYTLIHNSKAIKIPSYDVHHELRKMSKTQLLAYQVKHSINLKNMSDGSFRIDPAHGLKGGGLLGAKIGFWTGKILVHVGARIGFLVVAACSGPAAPAVYAGLEASCLLPLEAASNVVGLACGIAGGVATGPI